MLSYEFSSHLEPKSVLAYLVVPQMSFTADYLNQHPKENHILLLFVMSLMFLLTKNIFKCHWLLKNLSSSSCPVKCLTLWVCLIAS